MGSGYTAGVGLQVVAVVIIVLLSLIGCGADTSIGTGGQGGTGGIAGQGGDAPFSSGTGDLELAWQKGIVCQGPPIPYSVIRDVHPDSSGDVYVGGIINGDCAIFGESPESTTGDDLAVVRLAGSDGAVRWVSRFGEAGEVAMLSTAGGDAGIVTIGALDGELDLSGVVLEGQSFGTFGSAFLAHLDSDSSAVWGAVWPMVGFVFGPVAIHPDGGIFVGGAANGDIDFGGGTLDGDMFGVFFARFGAGGSHLFSYRVGGLGATTLIDDAAAASAGATVITGRFLSTWSVGSITLEGQPDEPTGYIAMVDVTGEPLWARAIPMEKDCELEVAVSDAAIIVCTTCDRIDFGDGFIGESDVYSAFITRLSPEGDLVWTRSLTSVEQAAVAISANGSIVVGGVFRDTIHLGDVSLESAGATDLVLVGVDGADGSILWSQRYGDAESQFLGGLAADADGGLFITRVDLTSEPGDSGNVMTLAKLVPSR